MRARPPNAHPVSMDDVHLAPPRAAASRRPYTETKSAIEVEEAVLMEAVPSADPGGMLHAHEGDS